MSRKRTGSWQADATDILASLQDVLEPTARIRDQLAELQGFRIPENPVVKALQDVLDSLPKIPDQLADSLAQVTAMRDSAMSANAAALAERVRAATAVPMPNELLTIGKQFGQQGRELKEMLDRAGLTGQWLEQFRAATVTVHAASDAAMLIQTLDLDALDGLPSEIEGLLETPTPHTHSDNSSERPRDGISIPQLALIIAILGLFIQIASFIGQLEGEQRQREFEARLLQVLDRAIESAELPTEPVTEFVVSTRVHLRTAAGRNNESIAILSPGDRFNRTETAGGWYGGFIRKEDGERTYGWVFSRYLLKA